MRQIETDARQRSVKENHTKKKRFNLCICLRWRKTIDSCSLEASRRIEHGLDCLLGLLFELTVFPTAVTESLIEYILKQMLVTV